MTIIYYNFKIGCQGQKTTSGFIEKNTGEKITWAEKPLISFDYLRSLFFGNGTTLNYFTDDCKPIMEHFKNHLVLSRPDQKFIVLVYII